MRQYSFPNFLGCLGIVVVSLGTGISMVGLEIYDQSKKSQAGYVDKDSIEIRVEDVNDDGKNETILEYKGRQFLWKESVDGVPVAIPFTLSPVIPTRIMPEAGYDSVNKKL